MQSMEPKNYTIDDERKFIDSFITVNRYILGLQIQEKKYINFPPCRLSIVF